jgi:hypothetical protein
MALPFCIPTNMKSSAMNANKKPSKIREKSHGLAQSPEIWSSDGVVVSVPAMKIDSASDLLWCLGTSENSADRLTFTAPFSPV